jgi:hypothetical protein
MQNPNLSLAYLTTLRMIRRCINPYVNVFVRAADHFIANPAKEVHIYITTGRTPINRDVRHYNVPTANEVVMIIPGELREVGNHDVIV